MVLLSILCVGAFLSAIFVTGMHDASNAIAVPVRTRTMGDTAALITAALFNGIGVFGVSADYRYECALDCRSQRAFGPAGADRRAHYRRLMGCGDLGLTHASFLNARPHRRPCRGGMVCPGRWRRLTVYLNFCP